MSKKNHFFNNKPTNYLKSQKFILFMLLLILLIIIFFVNNDYIFKIIEGNTSCKFSGDENLKKDTENKTNKYRKDKPDTSKTESKLNNVEDANVDI
jgi:hypothetical protein